MLKNFVLETANAPGTASPFNLGGAASGRLSFSGAGFTNGQVVFYVMDDGSQKEWGIGTFNTGSPNTMTRTTVISNTSGTTAKLNFSGTTNVYNGLPAENTVYKDSTGKAPIPGTTTNDDAAAGIVGEYISASCNNALSTVTITIATPAVITWTAHGLVANAPVQFTTTGALPTGLAASTTYYVVGASITANTFSVATSIANAIAGTKVATSGSQSGTQTAINSVPIPTATTLPVIAIQLTAGDWDVRGSVVFNPAGSTTVAALNAALNTAISLPALPAAGGYQQLQAAFTTGTLQTLGAGLTRFSLSATTIVYLLANIAFGVSIVNAYGFIAARRVR